jgi:hypothetical protein
MGFGRVNLHTGLSQKRPLMGMLEFRDGEILEEIRRG